MKEQEFKQELENENEESKPLAESPFKKRVDAIKEEYKRLFLGIVMALMLIYAIFLICNVIW